MKIMNHFDLGFHDTPVEEVYRPGDDTKTFKIPVPQSDHPDPMPTCARRSLGLTIAAVIVVLCIALSVAYFNLHHVPADNPSPAGGFPTKEIPPAGGSPTKDIPPASATGPGALAALFGLALVIGTMSFVLHLLRRIANPLYWQLACWLLVSVGILLRPFVSAGADPLQTTIKGALVAGIVALGVFPGLMRVLNRLKPEPGMMHVALPFALGFFLDVAQVVAKTYVPSLAWLQ